MITNYNNYIIEGLFNFNIKRYYLILKTFFSKYLINSDFHLFYENDTLLLTVSLNRKQQDLSDFIFLKHKKYGMMTNPMVMFYINNINKSYIIKFDYDIFNFFNRKDLIKFLKNDFQDEYYKNCLKYLSNKNTHVQNVVVLNKDKYSKFILDLIHSNLKYLKGYELYMKYLNNDTKKIIQDMLDNNMIDSINNAEKFDLI